MSPEEPPNKLRLLALVILLISAIFATSAQVSATYGNSSDSNTSTSSNSPASTSPANNSSPSIDNTTYEGAVAELYEALNNLSISLDEMIPSLNLIYWSFNSTGAELADLREKLEYTVVEQPREGCATCSNQTQNRSIDINKLISRSLDDYERANATYFNSKAKLELIHANVLARMQEVRAKLEELEAQGKISHSAIEKHEQAVQEYIQAYQKLNSSLESTAAKLEEINQIFYIIKTLQESRFPKEADTVVNYNPEIVLTMPDFSSERAYYLEGENVTINFRIRNNYPYNVSVVGFLYDIYAGNASGNITALNRSYTVVCEIKGSDAVVSNFTYPANFTGVHRVKAVFYYLDEEINRFRTIGHAELNYTVLPYYNLTEILLTLNETVESLRSTQLVFEEVTKPVPSDIDYSRLPHRAMNATPREPSTAFIDINRTIIPVNFSVSPEIRDIARQLGYDPQLIYSWVKEFEYQPYFGLMKGAEWTIHERAGNDFDQANVLVELLRASGIPAYFVYGTVEMPIERARMWLDVKDANEVIEAFQRNGIPARLEGSNLVFEHVWVEAYIPFEDGSRWMPLDPSFNIVEREPIEVEYMNASAWFNGSEYSATYAVKKLNLSVLNETVNESLINETPVLKPRIGRVYPYAPLNFTVLGHLGYWTEVPEKYVHAVSVELYGSDSLVFGLNVSVPEASIEGIYLDYFPTDESRYLIQEFGGLNKTPAYLVEVVPRLWVGERLVKSGEPVPIGEVQRLRVGFSLPEYDYFDKNVVAGGGYALVLNPGRMSVSLVEKRSFELEDAGEVYSSALEKQLLGMIFYSLADPGYDVASESYLLKWWRSTPGAAVVFDGVKSAKFGAVLLQSSVGLGMDVRRDVISTSALPEQTYPPGVKLTFMIQTGTDMSRYEAWAMMLVTNSTEAISTSEIMFQAYREGIDILMLTKDNFDEMVKILVAPPDVVRELREAVNANLIVMIPQRPVSIGEWRGTGWYLIGAGGAVASVVRKEGLQNGGLGICISCGIRNVIKYLHILIEKLTDIILWLQSLKIAIEKVAKSKNKEEVIRLLRQAEGYINAIKQRIGVLNKLPFKGGPQGALLVAMAELSLVIGHMLNDDIPSGCPVWLAGISCDITYVMSLITTSLILAGCPSGCAMLTALPAVGICLLGCFGLSLGQSKFINFLVSFCDADLRVEILSVRGVYSSSDPTVVEVRVSNNGRHPLRGVTVEVEGNAERCGRSGSNSVTIDTLCVGDSRVLEIPIDAFSLKRIEIRARASGVATAGRAKEAEAGPVVRESDMNWAPYPYAPPSLTCGDYGSATLRVDVYNAPGLARVQTLLTYLGNYDPESGTGIGDFSVKSTVSGKVPDCDCTPQGGKVGTASANYYYSIEAVGGSYCGGDSGAEKTDIFAEQCEPPPDDNVDPCDSCCYQVERMEDFKVVDVAVLTQGRFFDLEGLMGELKVPYEELSLDEFKRKPAEELGRYRVMLIPTGGLYDMSGDEEFKQRLREYVAGGGRVIVLSQARGVDYEALPGLKGKGYGESWSCIFQSSYLDTYHPVLATQAGEVFDINVDGVLTEYPENAEVIARRTAKATTIGRSAGSDEGKPIILAYEYGNGSFMVTSSYPDFSYAQGSLTEDLRQVFRDMLNWGRARGEIPSYLPGSMLRAEVRFKNRFSYAVEKPVVIILDPDYKIAHVEQVNISLAPGEEKAVLYSWRVPENAKTGIWSIEASTGAFWDRSYAAWFAVTKMAVAHILGISTGKESYTAGEGANLSVRIQNMVATPLEARLKVKVYEREEIYAEERNITVAGESVEEASFAFNVPGDALSGDYAVKVELYSSDGKLLDSRVKKVRVTGMDARIAFALEKGTFVAGENVTGMVKVENTGVVNISGLPLNIHIAGEGLEINQTRNVTLGVNESLAMPIAVLLPSVSEGSYTVRVALRKGATEVASQEAGFVVPPPAAEVEVLVDRESYQAGENVTAMVRVKNTGGVAIAGAGVKVVLSGRGYYEARAESYSGYPGEESSYVFSFALPSDAFLGNYTLSAEVSYRNLTLAVASRQVAVVGVKGSIAVATAKSRYLAGEPVVLSLNISNLGGVNLTGEYQVAVINPDDTITFNQSGGVFLAPGERRELSLTATLPEVSGLAEAVAWLYTSKGMLLAKSAEQFSVVKPNAVSVALYGEREHLLGDKIALRAEIYNDIGIDVAGEVSLEVGGYVENRSVLLAQGESEISYLLNLSEGEYNATVRVFLEGEEVARDVLSLRVHKPEVGVEVVKEREVYRSGEVLAFGVKVENRGVSLSGAQLAVALRKSGEVLKKFTRGFALPPNGTAYFRFDYTLPQEEGYYDIEYEVWNGDYRIAGGKDFVYVTLGDKVAERAEIEELGAEQEYYGDRNVTFSYRIINTGLVDTRARLSVDVSGIFTQEKEVFLEKGGEAVVNFTFRLSDLPEDDYVLRATLHGSSEVLDSEQRTFHLYGLSVKLVDVEWDKAFYVPGEHVRALFTFANVGRIRAEGVTAIIQHGGYVKTANLSMDVGEMRSIAFEFDIPVNATVGKKKVFYGVYTPAEMGIELGGRYFDVVDASDWVTLSTFKDIYIAGDLVRYTAVVRSLGNYSQYTLAVRFADIYAENTTLVLSEGEVANVTRDFRLPWDWLSGMYDIEYELYSGDVLIARGSHSFGVRGLEASITALELDKPEYVPGDEVRATVAIKNTGEAYVDGYVLLTLEREGVALQSVNSSVNLAPGRSLLLSRVLLLPLDAEAGEYSVRAQLSASGHNLSTKVVSFQVKQPEYSISLDRAEIITFRGAVLSPALLISNLGEAVLQEVTIYAEGEIAEWVVPRESGFSVAGGSTRLVYLDVAVPGNASTGVHAGRLVVNASHRSKALNLSINVSDVLVSMPSRVIVEEGANGSITLHIEGELSGCRLSSGEWVSLPEAFNVSGARDIEVGITVPEAQPPGNYTKRVYLACDGFEGGRDLTIEVPSTPEMEVSPSSIAKDMLRGMTSTVSFVITNPGNDVLRDVELSTSLPEYVEIPYNYFDIFAGQAKTVALSIRVPDNASYGMVAGKITARSGGIVRELPITIEILPIDVSVPIDITIGEGEQGRYALNFTNSYTREFNGTFVLEGYSSWFSPSSGAFAVPPSSASTVSLLISVPQAQAPGTYAGRVRFSTNLGEFWSRCTINVPERLDFTLEPAELSIRALSGCIASSQLRVTNTGNLGFYASFNASGAASEWAALESRRLYVPVGKTVANRISFEIPYAQPASQVSGRLHVAAEVRDRSGTEKSINVTLSIPDVAYAPSPISMTVEEGSQRSVVVSFASNETGVVNLRFSPSFGSASSWMSLDKYHMNLSGSDNLTLTISVPEGQAPGTYDAGVAISGDAECSIPVTVAVPRSESLSFSPESLRLAAVPQARVQAKSWIRNTGNTWSAFHIYATGEPSAWITLSRSSFVLAPQTQAEVGITIDVPSEVPYGTYTSSLVAFSDRQLAVQNITIEVTDISVVPTSIEVEIDEGTSHATNVSVANTQAEPLVVAASAEGYIKPWVSTRSITVPPSSVGSIPVTIAVPEGTPPGDYTGALKLSILNSIFEIPIAVHVPPHPEISVAPENLSLRAFSGSTAEAKVSIRNTGNVPLDNVFVEALHINGSWVSFSPNSFLLEVGQRAEVTATFSIPADAAGNYTGILRISTANVTADVGVELQVYPLEVYPEEIAATVNEGESGNVTISLTNPSSHPIRDVTLSSAGTISQWLEVPTITELPAQSTANMTITLRVPEGTPPGIYSGSLGIQIYDGTRWLPINVSVPEHPELSVSPERIEVVMVPESATTAKLLVKNAGNVPLYNLTASVLGVNGSWFNITPSIFDIAVQKTREVDIGINTSHAEVGDYAGELLIQNQNVSISLPLALHVYDIEIKPTLINATVNEGESQNRSITVRNLGNVSTALSIGVNGEIAPWLNVAEFIVVGPNATEAISLRIAVPEGQEAGTYYGEVSIAYDSHTITIPVYVDVPVRASLEVSKTSLYRLMPVNSSKNLTLELLNTGNVDLEVNISAEGNVSEWLTFERSVFIENQTSRLIEIEVTIPENASIGLYTGNLTYRFDNSSIYTALTIEVIPPAEIAPPPPSSFIAELLLNGTLNLQDIVIARNGSLVVDPDTGRIIGARYNASGYIDDVPYFPPYSSAEFLVTNDSIKLVVDMDQRGALRLLMPKNASLLMSKETAAETILREEYNSLKESGLAENASFSFNYYSTLPGNYTVGGNGLSTGWSGRTWYFDAPSTDIIYAAWHTGRGSVAVDNERFVENNFSTGAGDVVRFTFSLGGYQSMHYSVITLGTLIGNAGWIRTIEVMPLPSLQLPSEHRNVTIDISSFDSDFASIHTPANTVYVNLTRAAEVMYGTERENYTEFIITGKLSQYDYVPNLSVKARLYADGRLVILAYAEDDKDLLRLYLPPRTQNSVYLKPLVNTLVTDVVADLVQHHAMSIPKYGGDYGINSTTYYSVLPGNYSIAGSSLSCGYWCSRSGYVNAPDAGLAYAALHGGSRNVRVDGEVFVSNGFNSSLGEVSRFDFGVGSYQTIYVSMVVVGTTPVTGSNLRWIRTIEVKPILEPPSIYREVSIDPYELGSDFAAVFNSTHRVYVNLTRAAEAMNGTVHANYTEFIITDKLSRYDHVPNLTAKARLYADGRILILIYVKDSKDLLRLYLPPSAPKSQYFTPLINQLASEVASELVISNAMTLPKYEGDYGVNSATYYSVLPGNYSTAGASLSCGYWCSKSGYVYAPDAGLAYAALHGGSRSISADGEVFVSNGFNASLGEVSRFDFSVGSYQTIYVSVVNVGTTPVTGSNLRWIRTIEVNPIVEPPTEHRAVTIDPYTLDSDFAVVFNSSHKVYVNLTKAAEAMNGVKHANYTEFNITSRLHSYQYVPENLTARARLYADGRLVLLVDSQKPEELLRLYLPSSAPKSQYFTPLINQLASEVTSELVVSNAMTVPRYEGDYGVNSATYYSVLPGNYSIAGASLSCGYWCSRSGYVDAPDAGLAYAALHGGSRSISADGEVFVSNGFNASLGEVSRFDFGVGSYQTIYVSVVTAGTTPVTGSNLRWIRTIEVNPIVKPPTEHHVVVIDPYELGSDFAVVFNSTHKVYVNLSRAAEMMNGVKHANYTEFNITSRLHSYQYVPDNLTARARLYADGRLVLLVDTQKPEELLRLYLPPSAPKSQYFTPLINQLASEVTSELVVSNAMTVPRYEGDYGIDSATYYSVLPGNYSIAGSSLSCGYWCSRSGYVNAPDAGLAYAALHGGSRNVRVDGEVFVSNGFNASLGEISRFDFGVGSYQTIYVSVVNVGTTPVTGSNLRWIRTIEVNPIVKPPTEHHVVVIDPYELGSDFAVVFNSSHKVYVNLTRAAEVMNGTEFTNYTEFDIISLLYSYQHVPENLTARARLYADGRLLLLINAHEPEKLLRLYLPPSAPKSQYFTPLVNRLASEVASELVISNAMTVPKYEGDYGVDSAIYYSVLPGNYSIAGASLSCGYWCSRSGYVISLGKDVVYAVFHSGDRDVRVDYESFVSNGFRAVKGDFDRVDFSIGSYQKIQVSVVSLSHMPLTGSNVWLRNLEVKSLPGGTDPPEIVILSPQKITYTIDRVNLEFIADDPSGVSWTGYSIDDRPVVTSGNTTLVSLKNGTHLIKVYATDVLGYTGVNRTHFTVEATDSATPWWDTRWKYRRKIIAESTQQLIRLSLDHGSLVSEGKSLPNGDDVRVVFWNGSGFRELDRVAVAPWNSASTQIMFRKVAEPGEYYIYYGYLAAQAPPSNGSSVFDVYDDFSTDPASRWTLKGSAYWDSVQQNLVLTRNSNSQVGVAFSNQDIASTRWYEAFRYRAGGGSGADGFVAMFYKNKDYSPRAGGYLGFVAAGYGIEFDNYYNSGCDPSSNHIAIIKDGVCNHLTHINDGRTEDNQWHYVEVFFDNGVITVNIDGQPVFDGYEIPNFDYTYRGIGFSAATGGLNNWHIIDDYAFINDLAALSSVQLGGEEMWAGEEKIVSLNPYFANGTSGWTEYPAPHIWLPNATSYDGAFREGVVFIHPSGLECSNSSGVAQSVFLEAGKEYMLKLGIASAQHNIEFSCINTENNFEAKIKIVDNAGEHIIGQIVINSSDNWKDLVYDISAFAGKNVTIVFEVSKYETCHCEGASLDYLYVTQLGGG